MLTVRSFRKYVSKTLFFQKASKRCFLRELRVLIKIEYLVENIKSSYFSCMNMEEIDVKTNKIKIEIYNSKQFIKITVSSGECQMLR